MNCLNCGARLEKKDPMQQRQMQPRQMQPRQMQSRQMQQRQMQPRLSRSNSDSSFQKMLNLGTQSIERELGDIKNEVYDESLSDVIQENRRIIQSAEKLMGDINRQRPITPNDIQSMPSPLMVKKTPSGLPLSQRELNNTSRVARSARTNRRDKLVRSERSAKPSRERTTMSDGKQLEFLHLGNSPLTKKKQSVIKKQIQENLRTIKDLEKIQNISERIKLIKQYEEKNKKLMLQMKGGKKSKTKKSKTKTKKYKTKTKK